MDEWCLASAGVWSGGWSMTDSTLISDHHLLPQALRNPPFNSLPELFR